MRLFSSDLKIETLIDESAEFIGRFMHRNFPGMFYYLASMYHPLRAIFFIRKYPVKSKDGPKIILVGGEDGPDKLSTYHALYDLYPVLVDNFRVELMMCVSFRKWHIERIAEKKPDLVLLSFDSGEFQEQFEVLGVPIMGSSSAVCRKCYDKIKAGELAAEAGNLTAEVFLLLKDKFDRASYGKFKYPLVVKPRHGGSSQGVSKVNHPGELKRAVKKALKWDREVIIEKFIDGKEFTCTVYGNDHPETLPVNRKIMKFEQEEMESRGERILKTRFPVDSGEVFLDEIRRRSKEIYQLFGCRDMARIDWKYDDGNSNLYFLEINTLPWIGKNGGNIKDCAELAGFSYEGFIMNLFRESLRRISSQTL